MLSILNLANNLYGVYSLDDLLKLESKFSSQQNEKQIELLRKVLNDSPLRTTCEGYYSAFKLSDMQIREVLSGRGEKIIIPDDELLETFASKKVSDFYNDLFKILLDLLKSQLLTEVFIETVYFKIQTERTAAVVILNYLRDLGLDYSEKLNELEEASRLYVDHLPIWKDYGQISMD